MIPVIRKHKPGELPDALRCDDITPSLQKSLASGKADYSSAPSAEETISWSFSRT